MSTGADERDGPLEAYLAEFGEEDLGERSAPRMWEDGREVGEWTVTGFLARGGSSEVYCARHRRLGTRAALKVLWHEGAGPRERFAKETRFMMENRSASFPAFHGAGEEGGRPWLAMELLDECPVPTTDGEAARYLLEVGEGVAALHKRGWLHRDLKAGNILRRADGHAVLADFGLLKAIGEDETSVEGASPSVVNGREVGVGTPWWSAPEQFAGGEATPAADVYALGMLAENCFGGHPPRAWERIIRRATATLPRQRYPEVEPMLRAIRRRHWPRNIAWVSLACAPAVVAGVWGVWAAWKPTPKAVATPPPLEEIALPNVQEEPAEEQKSVVAEPETEPKEEPVAPPTEPATSPAVSELPVEKSPAGGIGRRGVPAERAAALERFEADEGRKEAILALVDDMEPFGYSCQVGRHEVTQRQWMALMEDNPSRFQGDDLPVDSLTLGACLEFLERLNGTSLVRGEGKRFRLPRAWEWQEVADDLPAETPEARLAAGWFAENAGGRTHPGGEKAGGDAIADLRGNVRELTLTWGEADGKEGFRCMGGSWADSAGAEAGPKVLEQPRYLLRHLGMVPPGVGNMPSDYPHAVCPAPGEIGFRLWAERADSRDGKRDVNLAKQAAEYWENEGREP